MIQFAPGARVFYRRNTATVIADYGVGDVVILVDGHRWRSHVARTWLTPL